MTKWLIWWYVLNLLKTAQQYEYAGNKTIAKLLFNICGRTYSNNDSAATSSAPLGVGLRVILRNQFAMVWTGSWYDPEMGFCKFANERLVSKIAGNLLAERLSAWDCSSVSWSTVWLRHLITSIWFGSCNSVVNDSQSHF
jgi:hypothetical protein